MKIHSIKAAFRFFIAVIVLLSAMAIFDGLVESIMNREMGKLHTFLGYEKSFTQLIVEERAALGNSSLYPKVVELYQTVNNGLKQDGYNKDSLIFRRKIYEHLYSNRQVIEQHHRRVRQILADLIASVRYIHEHHITYLKNLMRRGRTSQDYDMDRRWPFVVFGRNSPALKKM